MLHPVTLLLSWLALALALQWLPLIWLLPISLTSVAAATLLAADRCFNLLRRSRWLFLSLAVLYFFATPGEYLAGMGGDLGVTWEGLNLGGEQLTRLLAMLSSLALLHQVLGTAGLLGGFHWLLRPLPWREKTVVRLMLALEYAELNRPVSWREWLAPPETENGSQVDMLTLDLPNFRWLDRLMLILVLGLVLMVVGR